MLNTITAILDAGAGGGAGSYESIATVTSSGSSATLTFSSIPSTYSSLQIRGLYSGSGGLLMTFNGSSSAEYARHWLRGKEGLAQSTGSGYGVGYFNLTQSPVGDATTKHAMIFDLHDYSSTTKNKTFRMIDGYDENTTLGNVTLYSGLWGNTSAVTSITLDSNGTFASGSVFSLYGIKGA